MTNRYCSGRGQTAPLAAVLTAATSAVADLAAAGGVVFS